MAGGEAWGRGSESIGLPWRRRSVGGRAVLEQSADCGELKLSDDQRKAMDGILQDHRMKLVDLQASLKKAELEMQPLMKAEQPDQAAILAQIDKVAQARAELEKANARFLLALRGKLTPDQWKQLQTMRENRMDRMRDGDRGPAVGWGQGGQRPGMGGPGNQFHRQMPPPPGAAPQGAPAPPAPAPHAPAREKSSSVQIRRP